MKHLTLDELQAVAEVKTCATRCCLQANVSTAGPSFWSEILIGV
jgi:cytochrome c551/c552